MPYGSDKNAQLFAASFTGFLENSWPDQSSRLHQAIHYCLSGDGKRVRALLAMMVCESYGKDPQLALTAAIAVEMIHAYSLVHDDLPCMDNDDWRRGRPSLHKAFDDATALLAGDAILTDAMRVLVDAEFNPHVSALNDHQRLLNVRELTRAAGSYGMVYGQDQDMLWTGRGRYTAETLEKIHIGKTGGLIGASCAMGAVAAGVSESEIECWRKFGVFVGLAFQAIDDTLDDTDKTGKTKGKDAVQGKLTFLSLYANDEVLNLARAYTDKAIAVIPQGIRADSIVDFAKDLVFRRK
jgi:geranylgeranyl diphosphate synthase type II